MKYDHLVKHNGVYYPAWVEIPESHACIAPVEKEEVHDGVWEAKQYSRTEISRMSVADLKAYAPTIGIAVTEESTGADLKRAIIAKLDL